MAYSLKDFVLHTSPEILTEYCEKNSILFQLPEDTSPENLAKEFSNFFLTLDSKQSETIDGDFQEIKDLATEKGCAGLIEDAKKIGIELPPKIEQAQSTHDRATWFFLNQEKTFNSVSMDIELENATGWSAYDVEKVEEEEIVDKEDKLGKAVGEYYISTELRGRICKAECFKKDDLICYIAYPQDRAIVDIEYKKDKTLNRKTRQSVFKAYFYYNPDESRIYVKVKGGKTKKDDLAMVFCHSILDQHITANNRVKYNLDVFVKPSFQFANHIDDRIEKSKLMLIRFFYGGNEITLSLKDKENSGNNEMLALLTSRGIDREIIDIREIRFRTKFNPKQSLKRAKNAVTATITTSSCNLGIKKFDQVIKKYLREWKVADSSIKLEDK